MKSHTLPLIAVTVLLLPPAGVASTLISGDIGTASNWNPSGLPTNPFDPGAITVSNTGASQGTINEVSYSNLEILQTGGDVVRTVFGPSKFTSAVNWEMQGGTFTSISLGHDWDNSTVLINGGTLSFATLTVRGSNFSLSSGSLSTNNDLQSQSGTIFNFSGGTISIGRDAMLGFQPTTTYNFSGTADFNVTRNFGDIDVGVRTINLLAGTGTIDIGGFLEVDGMTIDWTSGSGYSLTTASLLDNGASTTWESLWGAGQLRVDGGNVGAFADNFVLNGNTLSLVPEPSTAALLAGGMAAFLFFRRRLRSNRA